MRTSPDFYKTREGEIIGVWQNVKPPEKSVLIYGYDYNRQKWVLDGKKKVEKLLFEKGIPIVVKLFTN
jgi:hypothetical protein